jgi:dTDP-4-amino-4,6-dideoxygalactose transaminase
MPQPMINFIDLQAQRAQIADKLEQRVLDVVRSGKYINGPEVLELEETLTSFSNTRHALGCSNGTDALLMPLMAWGIGPGDAVFVPAFTFVATAEVVALLGATPVFVDVATDTFNMELTSLQKAIDWVKQETNLLPKVIIPVDLFGLPSDLDGIEKIAKTEDIKILVDSAQGFASCINNKASVSYGDVGATSFFPAKPLGCYGDGGAIFTNDDDMFERLRSIRVHGQGTHRYDNIRLGINGRLDTLQAAILLEKLVIYKDEIEKRQEIASLYTDALSNYVKTPVVPEGYTSVWAQYTLQLQNRDDLAAFLKGKGIPTMVYYPKPLNQQEAYRAYPTAPGGVPNSERLAKVVLSLPMHPYLTREDQSYIIDHILTYLHKNT